LAPEQRRAVTMAVDEFHTIPGADYEQVFGELSKYGANMMLATQTLARLDRLTEADRSRDLRAAVFSNLDGLFAFHTSAEDAEYLVEELGGGLDRQDLLELGHYQCYARITDVRTGERLPSFSVRLDPPPNGDARIAIELAAESAQHYGRSAVDVDLDLQAAWERSHGGPAQQQAASNPGSDGTSAERPGAAAPDRVVTGAELPSPSGSERKRPPVQSGPRRARGRPSEKPQRSKSREDAAA
jgi:hypothetical protein